MMSQLLADIGTGNVSLLVLLVVGHVIGDFLLQTESMASKKEKDARSLVLHALLMFVAHAVVLWPLMSAPLGIGLLGIAAVHLALDAIRSRAVGAWGASLAAFFTDQFLHLVAVLILWSIVVWQSGGETVSWAMSNSWLAWYARWSAVAAAFVFNESGGTRIVRGVLSRFPSVSPDGTGIGEIEYSMGRTIGTLERQLMLILILLNQWTALGFILAAKSAARLPEIRARIDVDYAEYYLIGTLVSVTVALVGGVVVRAVMIWVC
jgi:hypothetical protein